MDSSAEPSEATEKTLTLEDAQEELAALLESGRITAQEVSALQHILKHQVPTFKEKVAKLKSLLGRSAKAQRETKVELEQTQKRLQASQEQNAHLKEKVEKLATRPTHMELLADFETNFDRALLHAQQQQQQQAGGQDTGAAFTPEEPAPSSVMDTMLLQELSEARARIEQLESLHLTLQQRCVGVEKQAKMLQNEKQSLQHAMQSLQLELKMAHMEAQHATRSLEDKQASLEEMQMELELVTKANLSNSVKANQLQTDHSRVKQLSSQVQALEEWALASAESKRLAMEHVKLLEKQLEEYKTDTSKNEALLVKKSSSMVVGAGDLGFAVVELPHLSPNAMLRWKFDVTPADQSVEFCILKGLSTSQTRADTLLPERSVIGGAAGEVEGAFLVQNACTLVWSNQKSWVRPRTIKYTVEAIAIHHDLVI